MEKKTDKQIIKELRTELKQTKAEKDELGLVIDNLPGHVYWLDKKLIFQGCNHNQAIDAHLKHRTDIKGLKIKNLEYNCDIKKINKINKIVLKTNATHIQEEIGHNAQGTRIYLSEKKPLTNKQGETIGIIGVSLDITKLKEREEQLKQDKLRAESAEHKRFNYIRKLKEITTGQKPEKATTSTEALQEIIDYLENIIAVMPGHVYWQDKNNVFLGCNNEQATSANLKSRKDIVGKTNFDMPWNKQAATLNKLNNKVMRIGKPYIAEEPAYMKNTLGVYLSHKVPLYDSKNNIVGTLGISFDITKRKRTEEQLIAAKKAAEIASKAKTDFIANISHDIRTPLSGIIGMAEILQKRVKKQENKLFVNHMQKSATDLLTILNEVIEFSKIEGHAEAIRQDTFNLKNAIINISELFKSKINEKNITLIIQYPRNIPQNMITDESRIRRIIINLVGNAVKFTERGEIKITVRMKKRNADKAQIELSVNDTGMGIPKEEQERIFDRFARTSASYQNKHKGTGLGLAIVKQFITDLDGKISVESEANKGSKFICTIPMLTTTLHKKINNKTKFQSKTKKTKKLNILLIEDDITCQLAEKTLLADLGHKITVASTGAEALDKIQQKYDLIISDIGLPDIDGLELCKRIRNEKNPNNETKIIALTAHVTKSEHEKFKNSGVNHTLSKPMNKKEISNLL